MLDPRNVEEINRRYDDFHLRSLREALKRAFRFYIGSGEEGVEPRTPAVVEVDWIRGEVDGRPIQLQKHQFIIPIGSSGVSVKIAAFLTYDPDTDTIFYYAPPGDRKDSNLD